MKLAPITGWTPRPLSSPPPAAQDQEGSKYKEDEVALPDHFINPYVGKRYLDSATEVLSVGLEHLADPENFVKLYRQNPEHLFLTQGALQSTPEVKW